MPNSTTPGPILSGPASRRAVAGDKIFTSATVRGISVIVFEQKRNPKAIFREGQVCNGILY
jgi:hypothetical protein